MSDSLLPHGLYPAKLLCPWKSPDKNTFADSFPLWVIRKIFVNFSILFNLFFLLYHTACGIFSSPNQGMQMQWKQGSPSYKIVSIVPVLFVGVLFYIQ